MTSPLLALQGRLGESIARLDAVDANLARTRLAVSQALVSHLSLLEEQMETRAAQTLDQLRARVIEKVAVGRYDDLTAREARTAVQMLATLTPRQVADLLARRPETWSPFAEGFFRNWDVTMTLPSKDALAGLLSRAPASVSLLHCGVPSATLVSASGPQAVANASLRPSLQDTMKQITLLGFRPRWSFTAHCIAHASQSFLQHRGLATVWTELASVPELSAALLPPPGQPGRRWFFPTAPSTSRGSTGARALFVASVLNTLASRGEEPNDSFGSALLDSEFRDPRIPPESLGWQLVRERAPAAYAAFLERLVREDLSLFFDHAMNEPARGRFWLGYMRSIRRTVCVLGPARYRDLASRIAGSAPAVKAALGRVRRFSADKGVSAFCLYFDNQVIVEFSDTGNAAYVYPRAVFDSQLEPLVMANRLKAHDELKRKSLTVARINHSSGWQDSARNLLLGLGVRKG